MHAELNEPRDRTESLFPVPIASTSSPRRVDDDVDADGNRRGVFLVTPNTCVTIVADEDKEDDEDKEEEYARQIHTKAKEVQAGGRYGHSGTTGGGGSWPLGKI